MNLGTCNNTVIARAGATAWTDGDSVFGINKRAASNFELCEWNRSFKLPLRASGRASKPNLGELLPTPTDKHAIIIFSAWANPTHPFFWRRGGSLK